MSAICRYGDLTIYDIRHIFWKVVLCPITCLYLFIRFKFRKFIPFKVMIRFVMESSYYFVKIFWISQTRFSLKCSAIEINKKRYQKLEPGFDILIHVKQDSGLFVFLLHAQWQYFIHIKDENKFSRNEEWRNTLGNGHVNKTNSEKPRRFQLMPLVPLPTMTFMDPSTEKRFFQSHHFPSLKTKTMLRPKHVNNLTLTLYGF